MIKFKKIGPKLPITLLGTFILLTLLALLKPGWKQIEGNDYSIKIPPSWKGEVLDKSLGPETFLLTVSNTQQIVDSAGYRTASTEIVRMILTRTARDHSSEAKTNTRIGGFPAYSSTAVSSGQIYKKEIRYSIYTPSYKYLLEVNIFEKGNLKAYWYEVLARTSAYSLSFSQ